MIFLAKSLNMVMTCTHIMPLYGSTPSSRLHVLVAHATVIPSSPQLQGFTTPASRSCSFVGRQTWWRQKSCLHNYAGGKPNCQHIKNNGETGKLTEKKGLPHWWSKNKSLRQGLLLATCMVRCSFKILQVLFSPTSKHPSDSFWINTPYIWHKPSSWTQTTLPVEVLPMLLMLKDPSSIYYPKYLVDWRWQGGSMVHMLSQPKSKLSVFRVTLHLLKRPKSFPRSLSWKISTIPSTIPIFWSTHNPPQKKGRLGLEIRGLSTNHRGTAPSSLFGWGVLSMILG